MLVGMTRHDAAVADPCRDPCHPWRASVLVFPSRFLTEIPQDAVSVREGAPVRAAFAGASQQRAVVPLEAGDTVMHQTFGEGVVTGVESRGSLVRVRLQTGTEPSGA